MKSVAIALLLASSIRLWSQEATPKALLPKETEVKFQSHAADLYHAADNIEADLQLSIPDERVYLHLHKRGFRYLTFLLYNGGFYNRAAYPLIMPVQNLKTSSREEAVAEELLGQAVSVRLAAYNYACFQILKEIAPTPEAMKYEAQAKELSAKMFSGQDYNPTEAEFLQDLESVRVFFDKLNKLPKLTAQQLADERAETAVLAPGERGDYGDVGFPV